MMQGPAGIVVEYAAVSHQFGRSALMTHRPPKRVRCRGVPFTVRGTERLRGRTYWLIDRLGNRGRRKLQVYDPVSKDLRIIHLLPRSRHTEQQLHVLRRAGRLDGFPTVHDLERRKDEVWLMTSWIWGTPLSRYLDGAREGSRRWPSAHTAWTLYCRFAHCLSQFHDFTMCAHGDIKPGNLIIQAEPQRLRLIDFGSAWYEENAKRRELGDGHSVGYAAPEVRAGGRATTLADQFSTNVVLYEMLTGELPYEGMGGRAGWAENIQAFADTFQLPSGRCRGDGTLPRSAWKRIDQIVRNGVALNADERFTTSNAWRDAVDEVTRGLSHSLAQPPWHRQVVDTIERVVSFLGRGRKPS